jgi:hypothetical protein
MSMLSMSKMHLQTERSNGAAVGKLAGKRPAMDDVHVLGAQKSAYW